MRTKHAIGASAAALAALCAAAVVATAASAYAVEIPLPPPGSLAARPSQHDLYRGETARFAPSANGGEGWRYTLYWQTNGMAEAWWTAPGLDFAPSMDCGASVYRWFVRGERDGDGVSYRANGTLRMLASPGFAPNWIEPPIRTLDFTVVSWTNAPWAAADAVYTRGEVDALVGAVDVSGQLAEYAKTSEVADAVADVRSEVGEVRGRLSAVSGEVARVEAEAVKSVNGKKGDVALNAADVGAVAVNSDIDLAWSFYKMRLNALNGIRIEDDWQGGTAVLDSGRLLLRDTKYSDYITEYQNGFIRHAAYNPKMPDNPFWRYLYFPTNETGTLVTDSRLALATNAIDVSSQLTPINAAIDAATNRVMVLDQNVQRMYVNSMASNVWFSVTNYDSVVHIPSLRMYEIRDGKIRIVWDEVTMHQRTLEAAIDAAAQMTAALAENMPSRAWGLVTSGSGAPAPANTTWVSSKKLVVAGEFEYKHVLTATDGMQFLCKMDGAEFGMNTNGMIRIEDGGGNVLFEIESKKVAIPDVRIKDVTVSPDRMSYAIHVQKQQGKDAELLEHPWLVVGDTLNTMLNETNSACLYNAQWTLANGVYTCNIWRKDGTRPPNGSFAKFVCDESNIGGGGGVMAKLNAPLKCQGVMSEDGTKTAKPVFNADGTVTWRWRD